MSAQARRSGAAATRAVKPAECLQCEIRHIALCSAVDDPDVARLQALVTHVWFYGGQTISTEGDLSEHVYNVASGTVRLYKLLPDGRRQLPGFSPSEQPSYQRHLERPHPHDHRDRDADDQRLERQAHAPVVAEMIAARSHDEHVVLVADRRQEGA